MRLRHVIALAVLASACTGGSSVTTAAPTTTPITEATITSTLPETRPPVTTGGPTSGVPAPSTTTGAPVPTVPTELSLYDTDTIVVGGRELLVAVADTASERASGLMFVDDLGPLDGMLFVWGEDTTVGFWMYQTLMSLDIAWFDADGALVSSTRMTPCEIASSCPTYEAAGPYRFALELPAGKLSELGQDPRLVLGNVA